VPKPRHSDEEVVELIETKGMKETSRILKLNLRSLYKRRENLEAKLGRQIHSGGEDPRGQEQHKYRRVLNPPPGRRYFDVKDGIILIGSDAHYWPNYVSTAHKAFVDFCGKLKPKVVCLNGDMVDGATISRWPMGINEDHKPSVVDEIATVQERLEEIRNAAKNAALFWPLGNHDARFENRLGHAAREYCLVHGFSLKDHFPYWHPCYSLWINDELVIKHRFKGGIHARHNNTVWSGKHICTGHLHRLGVTPFTDYNGTRFGIECGTMADEYGPQFEYIEDNPRNWQSGFVVVTIKDGHMMHPEMVRVVEEGVVEFRGEFKKYG